jgi:hypothetical protein
LEAALDTPQLSPVSTALATAEQLEGRHDLTSREDDSQELALRIRELAKRESAVTANTLRIWLLQNETAKSGVHHVSV